MTELCAALDAWRRARAGWRWYSTSAALGTILVDLLDRRMPVVVAVTGGAAAGWTAAGWPPCPGARSPPGCCSRRSGAPSGRAGTLPLAPRFAQALQGFRFRAPAAGGGDALEEARREADDALVLAAGLCAWQTTREVPGGSTPPWSTAAEAMIGDYDPHAGRPVILGLDPGQRRDPAGLAVVDGFDILHLERVLGLPYPDLAERVAMVLAQLPVAYPGPGMRWADPVGGYAGRMRAEVAAIRATPVVVDATGVGRAVVDLLEARAPDADRGDAHGRRQGACQRPRGEPAAARPVPAAAGGAGGRQAAGGRGLPLPRRAGAGAAGGARRAVRRGKQGRGPPRGPRHRRVVVPVVEYDSAASIGLRVGSEAGQGLAGQGPPRARGGVISAVADRGVTPGPPRARGGVIEAVPVP